MIMNINDDVKAVAAFMQRNITADGLVPTAKALAEIAPLLWGHFNQREVRAITLEEPPIPA